MILDFIQHRREKSKCIPIYKYTYVAKQKNKLKWYLNFYRLSLPVYKYKKQCNYYLHPRFL